MRHSIFQSIVYSILCVSLSVHAEKILVAIDTFVREIDQSTPCVIEQWGNKLENSCKCSLVKRYPDVKSGAKSASQIIQEALDKGRCDSALINDFLHEYVSPQASFERATPQAESVLKQLIESIAYKSIVIKHVKPTAIAFDQFGNFTVESLKQFLVKAHADKKLLNDAFARIDCIEVKDLIDEKGYNTLQLFLIKASCGGVSQEFILKEMASKQEEVVQLAKASVIKELQPYVLPASVPDYPSIALPLAYLSYEYAGKKHYLSLMPKAEGVQLAQLMNQFKQNSPAGIKDLVADAYYHVGRKMAFLQKKFMQQSQQGRMLGRTIAHGDFHKYNIFFDPKTKAVTLIDNERLAQSFTNDRSPMSDFTYLIYYSLDSRLTPDSFKRGFDMSTWLKLVIYNFVKGYLSTFDQSQRAQVLSEIRAAFTDPSIYGGTYRKNKQAVDAAFNQLAAENK